MGKSDQFSLKTKSFLDGLRASAMSAMSMGIADDEVEGWKFVLTKDFSVFFLTKKTAISERKSTQKIRLNLVF